MKLVLHIFKKDARHLWPQIAATLVILAALAREDRWRTDWVPGPTEGWLNVLLPIAWACLIGLAVGQEPLTGGRQFWITRPYRRSGLLAAKALFAVAFVHLPFLVAQSYVVSSHGFSPLAYLPELLWKQLLLAAALTLPALALAALAGTFTHFIMEVVAVAAAMAFLSGTFQMPPFLWNPAEEVRRALIILLVCLASIAIAWMQYFGRRVVLSRSLGIAAGIAAGILFACQLPQSAFALRSSITPVQEPVSLTIAESGRKYPYGSPPYNVTIPIPVAISGVPAGVRFHLQSLASTIVASGGERYEAPTRVAYQSFEKIRFVSNFAQSAADLQGPDWLLLSLDRATYERLKSGPVEITGAGAVTEYRMGETSWMAPGTTQPAAGVGRCTSSVVEVRWSEDMLKVECELPSDIPHHTHVRLWHPESGRDWNGQLGDAWTSLPGPRTTWLSGLDRVQKMFQIADDPKGPGSQWLVPRSALSTARIAITPELVTGYSVLKYDLKGVELARFATAAAR